MLDLDDINLSDSGVTISDMHGELLPRVALCGVDSQLLSYSSFLFIKTLWLDYSS